MQQDPGRDFALIHRALLSRSKQLMCSALDSASECQAQTKSRNLHNASLRAERAKLRVACAEAMTAPSFSLIH